VQCCPEETRNNVTDAFLINLFADLALALGNTVKASFDIGAKSVMAEEFQLASHDLFLLLPETGDHNVKVRQLSALGL
jgi:hypothetical protein